MAKKGAKVVKNRVVEEMPAEEPLEIDGELDQELFDGLDSMKD